VVSPMARMSVLALSLASASALRCGGIVQPQQSACVARSRAIVMDETILEKALAGELEQEGAENVFMTEVGWASYLDKQGQSYNLNERASVAQDGYFTPDVFSNPLDVLSSWKDSMLRVASDPLAVAFPTISNDETGNRSFGKADEVQSRTIKPKVKDFDSKKRIVGIPGFNLFGAPSSKSEDLPATFGAPQTGQGGGFWGKK